MGDFLLILSHFLKCFIFRWFNCAWDWGTENRARPWCL